MGESRDSPGDPVRVVRTSVTDMASALAAIEQLENAVVSNRVISMAAGILMERHRVDAPRALHQLRRSSNELNVKLAAVAAAVVEAANACAGSRDTPGVEGSDRDL